MGHHEACGSFVQYKLPGVDDLCQLLKHRFDHAGVWYQKVYDLRPGLIKTLVPNARREEFYRILEALGRGADVFGTLVKEILPPIDLNQIHFVYQAKDLGVGGAFLEGADDVTVVYDVGGELARLDVEDKD
jgi:hypothetical protein